MCQTVLVVYISHSSNTPTVFTVAEVYSHFTDGEMVNLKLKPKAVCL